MLKSYDASARPATSDAENHRPLTLDEQCAGYARHAEALADWALTRLAVRRDVHGRYTADGGQYTSRDPLDRELLIRHFRSEVTVGFHSTSPDGKCLAVALDIDAHDDKADPDANWRCAQHAVGLFAESKLTAIICGSDGGGGYHVRVFFKASVPSAVAYWLGERIKAALTSEGFAPCEAFPKQPELTLDHPYGNWIRIPGKHHKRDCWTRIYDPANDRWLEGEGAALRLLKVAGDDPAELLKAYRADQETRAASGPEAKPKEEVRKRHRGNSEKATEAELRSALDALPDSWADEYGGERGNTAWLGVGMALQDWDASAGLPLWIEFSARSSKSDEAACHSKWTTFTQGGGVTVATIFKAARDRGWTPPGRPAKAKPSLNGNAERIPVEITTRRHEVLRETVAALSRDKGVYSLGESLVTVAAETDDEIKLTRSTTLRGTAGAPTVLMLSGSVIGCILTSVADFWRWQRDKGGELIAVSTHPPEWLIRSVETLKRWRDVRPLLGVSECPFPHADGSIVSTRGYDAETGVYYRPAITFPPVPDRPTRDDARAAWDRLRRPFAQFPFKSPDDLVVWFAALLTAMIRPAFPDPTPGIALVGNKPGTGKGLLADTIGVLAQGRRNVPTTAYPADPIEAAKVNTAVALSGKSIVHFDNLEEGSTYGNSALDSALTSTVVDGRILGTSRMTGEIPLRVLFMISGNNISPGKDAHRRWLPCNLVTDLERPEERGDIAIEDLRSHLLEHRGELVRDALTVLRAHALEGRPKGKWAPLGSFEQWDRIIRGAVWYATDRDCCATRRTAADESPDRLAKIALLEGWLELPDGKATTAQAVEKMQAKPDEKAQAKPDEYPTLRNALMHYGKDGKLATARALGNIIRGMKGNLIDGKKFVNVGKDHQSVIWQVVKTDPSTPDNQKTGASSGTGGESGESGESDFHSPRVSFGQDNYAIMYGGIRDASGNESERHSPDSPDSPTTDGADDDEEVTWTG